ncbi:MAG: VanW family protein [Eubacteriales bacterium]|nr:VanW family protein [Eubacteriales bacterium]
MNRVPPQNTLPNNNAHFDRQPMYTQRRTPPVYQKNNQAPNNMPPAPNFKRVNPQNGMRNRRPQKSNKNKPWLKVLVAFLLVAIVVALIVYGLQQIKRNRVLEEIAPYENVYGPEIYINDISISGLTPDQALSNVYAKMQERVESWKLNIIYNGWEFYKLDYRALGIDFSHNMLYPYLNEAWMLTHTGDEFMRKEALLARAGNPYKIYTTKQEFNVNNLDIILQQIANSINKAPMDAALIQFRPDEPNPFLIRDEQVGIQLDTEKTKQEILELAAAGTSGNYEISPIITQPKITRADVEKTVTLRAEASTAISKYSVENRNNNIRLSLAKINGTYLEPGESFSFNKVVGPRTLKAGFFEADEMVKGDLVTGVGGGVCQSSSTLYQAVLAAALSVTDRDIHSAPVGYTEKGLDATVYLSRDRNIDFKFKNTSPGRIYITAHVVPGSSSKSLISRIRIYGESLGDGVVYKLKSVIDEELSEEEIKYIPDKKGEFVTYKDETKLKRKAEKGYVVSSYLRKYQNGNLIEENLVSVDTYRPRPAEYWIGTQNR